jgi:NAD(P)-dependent dehydrogenase (short-subunit alcohol dehydrogenase family)
MGELDGQVAIVTGSGRGIGQAIALGLAAAGAAVGVTARSMDQLQETVERIEVAGGRALASPGEVTDPATVARTVPAVEAQFGPVDLLVNNAGALGPNGGVVDGDAREWWQACAVNLYAPFLWSQAVLPGMLARGRGRIIHVGTAIGPLRRADAYFVSKSALVRLAEGMAAEGRRHGVFVFAMTPGSIPTEMSREFLRRLPPHLADPGRYQWSQLEDPARRCVVLASGRADALTGRYIEMRDDLDDLIQRADAIREQDLYVLRLRT